jgi:agmatinase
MIPTFSVFPSFLGTLNQSLTADVCIAGIPLDLGTSNRAGSRFGPSAIRHASRMLVDGEHPIHSILSMADIGDFNIVLGDLVASLQLIEQQAKEFNHLISIGGDHSISLPLLRALHSKYNKPLSLVHFDAHVDTWPDTFGQTYGHGSTFFHAINEDLINPYQTVQIGIRSPMSREVYEWTINKGVTIISAIEVHEQGPAITAGRISEIVGETPTYLTFDIDALDPAFAPGTGTPEIGGLASWQAQSILRKLTVPFVGMDIVEVAPAYDISEITALAAATIIWEYLAMPSVVNLLLSSRGKRS